MVKCGRMDPHNRASMPPKSREELVAENERPRHVNEQYQQWTDSHNRLIAKAPTEGKAFIRHAKTLLHFLEGISEIQPIFKGTNLSSLSKRLTLSLAVVFTFKTVVLYESERAENDNRISCVFLAQANMMDVLMR